MQTQATTLEGFFAAFKKNIIGDRQYFDFPFGKSPILYADWTASGRAYWPIEERIHNDVMPFLANTHTETTITGTLMSRAYEEARRIVKAHVHAGADDALVFCGSGMTGAVNKLQRILGWRVPERLPHYLSGPLQVNEDLRPVVFVTHMEHHSHQISWLETIATVEIIGADEEGNVDLGCLRGLLQRYKYRKNKIAAVTACSNVTGIQTPYHEIAKLVHEYEGYCFVDFACSAPYIDMDMHPGETGADIDALYFSPHKFLGGPGTPGVLIFNKSIYHSKIPDQPGGGTVVYSNPWKAHEYVNDIEQREDGGTPPFLGAIKAAMCIRLKEKMGTENILRREEEILRVVFDRFAKMENVHVLQGGVRKRLGVVAFIIPGAHYNLVVKMLNDRFGLQTRGGCSCAGTYGHRLLQVDERKSLEIWNRIRRGDMWSKPGWVRLSVHPTMTDAEIEFMLDAIELTSAYWRTWAKDYHCDVASGQYFHRDAGSKETSRIEGWFTM